MSDNWHAMLHAGLRVVGSGPEEQQHCMAGQCPHQLPNIMASVLRK